MLQLYHSSNADKIDSVISYSGGTMAAFVNWSSGKPGSALVNTKIKGPGPHPFDSIILYDSYSIGFFGLRVLLRVFGLRVQMITEISYGIIVIWKRPFKQFD